MVYSKLLLETIISREHKTRSKTRKASTINISTNINTNINTKISKDYHEFSNEFEFVKVSRNTPSNTTLNKQSSFLSQLLSKRWY